MENLSSPETMAHFAKLIKQWGLQLGFQQVGISDINLGTAETRFTQWIDHNYHGKMDYMTKHGSKRTRPEQLIAGTQRIISVRMNYLPDHTKSAQQTLDNNKWGYISRYALGRDYHKTLRKRLQKLSNQILQQAESLNLRVFVDSAPVLEKPIAQQCGLGWIGKHTNLINQHHGSWFFLGEIYINLPLPIDQPTRAHCGTCQHCIDICPTNAIIAPYQLDARKCISYLTIELKTAIPEIYRPLIGNRIYGCDDCQLVCPWNKFAKPTAETDFLPRHHFDAPLLKNLFQWTKTEFLSKTEGSAMRRVGYDCFIRNIAIALGNSHDPTALDILKSKLNIENDMVKEHIIWAIHHLTKSRLN